MSVLNILKQTVKTNAEKAAFIYADDDGFHNVTYRAFYAAAGSIAGFLREKGVEPGSRVLLLAGYGPQWCAAYMGIHFCGATAIPLDAQYTPDEVKTIYHFTEPSAILCDHAHRDIMPMDADSPIMIDDAYKAEPQETEPHMDPLPDQAPMSIIFTSGTTGDPKGVMLSEGNFLSNVTFLQEYHKLIGPKDVILSILPLHHVYGFTCTFLTPVLTGCTTVFPRSISGADISAAVIETGVTILVAVPQVLALFHKKIFDTVEQKPFIVRDMFRTMQDITRWTRRLISMNPGKKLFSSIHKKFPKLRYLTSGGARLEPEILQGMQSVGFSIIEAYGLTETSPIACFNNPNRPVPGSVGKAITDVEVKIEKEEGGFEQGEICIKGANVMQGYYKRPDATEKAIQDGWFHSGDLGHMDAQGRVYITGRKKEIIILPNGKNVYPEELEKQYINSPRIAEVCVLPLGEPGKEQLTAAVYPDMKYFKAKRSGNIHQEVKYDIESIAVHLPSYQRVTRVELVDQEFPRTRLGKLQRFKIKDLLLNKDAARSADKEDIPRETDDPFLRFLMAQADLDFVPQPEHNIETDLGLDSLNKLELFAAMEKRFGTVIDQEQAGEIISVQNLIDIVGDAADSGDEGGFDLAEEIRQEPSAPLKSHVAVGWGLFGSILRFSAHFILKIFIKLIMGAKIKGLKNIPKDGPFIIAANHVSYFDALVLYAMLPYTLTRKIYSLSLPEIFQAFPLNILRKPARVIMTGTHDTMIDSMRYSRQVLEQGLPMIIFPEGKRSVEGRVDKPKNGVFVLARECNAPLIPVYLSGFTGLYSRLNPGFHRVKLTAEVLPPQFVEEDIVAAIETWHETMKAKNTEEFGENAAKETE